VIAIEQEVLAFVEEHAAVVAQLYRRLHLAAWDAATTGSDQAMQRYAEAQTAVRKLYSDGEAYARVRAWLAEPELRDAALRRQLVLLRHSYAGNQMPPEVIEDLSRRGAALEQVFHTFRSEFDGERVSNNRLLDVLREERDEAVRRRAWEASKQIAREIAEPLRELARRRNAAARALGFANFYSMSLELQEIDEAELFTVLDEFRDRSEMPFRRLRESVDQALAGRHGVPPERLRPWHWEDFFGQEAPAIGEVDLDGFFAGRDLVELAARYCRDIGLAADDVIARSDLYERENKDQHAFAMDVDREGDVRMLCNMRDNEKWMSTLLHELGHAVYDKYLPGELPFLLRTTAHTMTTEAIAMYMGRLTRRAGWLRAVMGAELSTGAEADLRRQSAMSLMIATRWMLVMAYFERELYRDPDRPDLNTLWWDLVERLQLIRRPDGRDEPDWAAKIHFSIAPVYYHNYLLGELTASQLTATFERLFPAAADDARSPDLGKFLRERVFAYGATLSWNELVREATGEPLRARYFIEQFLPD
jgi:peptidyl-dipeptidase A